MGRLYIAASPAQRLRGLLFTQPGDDVLLLAPCRGVHTFGMGYALDIAFLDKRGRVVESYRDVMPKRRLRCSRARAVLERYAQPRRAWYIPGDYMDAEIDETVPGKDLR